MPSNFEIDFKTLFEELAPQVHRFFRRKGYAVEECRDLTQETFLKAYRGQGTFRRDASPKTWLFSIASNVSRNTIRDRRADKRSGTEEPFEESQHESRISVAPSGAGSMNDPPDPLDQLIRVERRGYLRTAMDELPPRMRRALLLRVDQGLKYREIAVVMDIEVNTVKALLHQAKTRLQEMLGEAYEPGEG